MKFRNIIIIVIVSVFILAGFLFLCSKRMQTIEDVALQEVHPYKDAEIKAVLIPSENNTFGYDIYLHDAILIHQPSRPSLPGNSGFATEEDAMKVAELVIKKIRKNEMPPTVTIEELHALGVIKYE